MKTCLTTELLMTRQQSLHPLDARRERDRARHQKRMRKLFGGDHQNRTQDQLQSEAAEKLKAEKAERAARERALWNKPAPQQAPRALTGRIRKSH